MRIALLTRTNRPSGAAIAAEIMKAGKELVAIVAESRQELVKKKKSLPMAAVHLLKVHGFRFIFSRLVEASYIRTRFFLRKALPKKLFEDGKYCSVKELVLEYHVPLFVVKNHNSNECIELLHSLEPDLCVIANTRILSPEVIRIPKQGCINFHSSLLPHYRGCASVFWILYNGETETGVTVHFLDENLDTGDIILQRRIPIGHDDTEKTLHNTMIQLGARLIVQAILQIEQGNVNRVPQGVNEGSYFSWPTKQQRKQLAERLRGRNP